MTLIIDTVLAPINEYIQTGQLHEAFSALSSMAQEVRRKCGDQHSAERTEFVKCLSFADAHYGQTKRAIQARADEWSLEEGSYAERQAASWIRRAAKAGATILHGNARATWYEVHQASLAVRTIRYGRNPAPEQVNELEMLLGCIERESTKSAEQRIAEADARADACM